MSIQKCKANQVTDLRSSKKFGITQIHEHNSYMNIVKTYVEKLYNNFQEF